MKNKNSVRTEKKFSINWLIFFFSSNWNFFTVLLDISKNQWRSTGGKALWSVHSLAYFFLVSNFLFCFFFRQSCHSVLWLSSILSHVLLWQSAISAFVGYLIPLQWQVIAVEEGKDFITSNIPHTTKSLIQKSTAWNCS